MAKEGVWLYAIRIFKYAVNEVYNSVAILYD
jgi:hypothetical protein